MVAQQVHDQHHREAETVIRVKEQVESQEAMMVETQT